MDEDGGEREGKGKGEVLELSRLIFKYFFWLAMGNAWGNKVNRYLGREGVVQNNQKRHLNGTLRGKEQGWVVWDGATEESGRYL